MSLIEKTDNFRPETGEAPFEAEEIFFSLADKRGVIQTGNFVFQRISHYSWDELEGAPHKIVRHPDMPKGVFRLLWDTISTGRPMGSYIKAQFTKRMHGL